MCFCMYLNPLAVVKIYLTTITKSLETHMYELLNKVSQKGKHSLAISMDNCIIQSVASQNTRNT